jgi:HSP20 family protein
MTNIVKFHPYPSTKTFVNGLFDEFFNRNLADHVGADNFVSHTPVNVIETDDAFKIELAAPGFDKQNFTLQVENDQLTIEAKHETKQEETTERYTRREFKVNAIKRSFKLPKTVNQDAINAVYENGILNVTIGKKEETKPAVKTITIG